MDDYNLRPMLGEYFAMDFLANAVKKKWSGGYEVSGFAVMLSSVWIFQKGAILGRAKDSNVMALAKLVSIEGNE